MSVATFFDQVVKSVGGHIPIDRSALEARLAPVAPGVECSPRETAGAWTDELLVNMLARLYPRIVLFGDPRTVEHCRSLARLINPNIDTSDAPTDATFVASTVAGTSSPTTLAIGSRGWLAYVGGEAPSGDGLEPNAFAAAAAAALAARDVFRRLVLLEDTSEEPVRWNLLSVRNDDTSTLPSAVTEPHDVELGELLVAGVGAVGNAALWCLCRQPRLRGNAWVIDPENIELSNLQRYVLALHGDIGLSKTLLAKRELERDHVHVRTIDGRLGGAAIPNETDRILVTVDNEEGRVIAQSLLPRLVVSGWTSASGLGASWHDFALGRGCLACVYHPAGPLPSESELVANETGLTAARAVELLLSPTLLTHGDLSVMARRLGRPLETLEAWVGKPLRECYRSAVCGEQAAPVGVSSAEVVVPLVHQSVLAGVLAAAELVKRCSSQLAAQAQKQNAVEWADISRPCPPTQTKHYNNTPGCICRDPDYRRIHTERWSTRTTSVDDE